MHVMRNRMSSERIYWQGLREEASDFLSIDEAGAHDAIQTEGALILPQLAKGDDVGGAVLFGGVEGIDDPFRFAAAGLVADEN